LGCLEAKHLCHVHISLSFSPRSCRLMTVILHLIREKRPWSQSEVASIDLKN
jgi:hypothetical protein